MADKRIPTPAQAQALRRLEGRETHHIHESTVDALLSRKWVRRSTPAQRIREYDYRLVRITAAGRRALHRYDCAEEEV